MSFSRAQGDIHVFGNPHIWTDPLNVVLIARNILTGLKRVAPQDAEYFTTREKDFEDRIYRALFGDELVRLLGGPTLADLDRQGKLFDYIEPKPGIPPTPRHVQEIITAMRDQHIQVLLSTNYYDRNQVLEVAQRTGAKAVIVPSNTGGSTGVSTYVDLVNLWVSELARAFSPASDPAR
jgi:zinc/manganese transport system substrate-binding protein